MKYIVFCFILFFALLSSCNPKGNNIETSFCNSDIESIEALYFNSIFDRVRSLGWNDIEEYYLGDTLSSRKVVKTTITDCDILKEIYNEIKYLKPADVQYPADARIALTLNMRDGSIQQYCIGWSNAAAFYTKEYRGTLLESPNTNKLLYLIKNNIGYYSWFSKDELEYMNELHDTTFVKEASLNINFPLE